MPKISNELRAIDEHVGRAIKTRREALGMSQSEVAEQTGVTYQQLHKYEKGINRVTAGRLAAIALALGVRVADLFPFVPPAVLRDVGLPDEVTTLDRGALRLLKDTARGVAELEAAREQDRS